MNKESIDDKGYPLVSWLMIPKDKLTTFNILSWKHYTTNKEAKKKHCEKCIWDFKFFLRN